ncbi:hypothetical protein [Halorubrum miltondacostae]|uniref:Uncharacterized protein n=1 Tax=Halorubrum miltondacostae TaxID=3076378 RepID=A0ABD5M364_9EURY
MGVSRTYASERLKRLVEHNHVEKIAPGLYELVDDPRDDLADDDDVEELKGHVRAAGRAIEDQNVDALRRHVRAACEVLDNE